MLEITVPVPDEPDDVIVVPEDDQANEPVASEPEEPVIEGESL